MIQTLCLIQLLLLFFYCQNNSYEDTFMHERAFNLGMFLKLVSVQSYITAHIKDNTNYIYFFLRENMISFIEYSLILIKISADLIIFLYLNIERLYSKYDLLSTIFVDYFMLFLVKGILIKPILGIFLVIFLRLNIRKILYSIRAASFKSQALLWFLFIKNIYIITKSYFTSNLFITNNLKTMKKYIYNNNIKLLQYYINFFSYSFNASIIIQKPNIIFGFYKKVFKDSIQSRTGANISLFLIKNVIN